MKLYGAIWGHLDPSGTIWDHMGPYGAIWPHMGDDDDDDDDDDNDNDDEMIYGHMGAYGAYMGMNAAKHSDFLNRSFHIGTEVFSH